MARQDVPVSQSRIAPIGTSGHIFSSMGARLMVIPKNVAGTSDHAEAARPRATAQIRRCRFIHARFVRGSIRDVRPAMRLSGDLRRAALPEQSSRAKVQARTPI